MTPARRHRLNYWLGLACLAVLLTIIPPGGISAWSWKAGLRWLYVALVAFFAVNSLMPLAIATARRLGAMDQPDPRKVHPEPTPRLGGLAVFAAVLFALWRAPAAGFLGCAFFLLLAPTSSVIPIAGQAAAGPGPAQGQSTAAMTLCITPTSRLAMYHACLEPAAQ